MDESPTTEWSKSMDPKYKHLGSILPMKCSNDFVEMVQVKPNNSSRAGLTHKDDQ